jgi:hypothetical protein
MNGGIVHPSAPPGRRFWGILDGRPSRASRPHAGRTRSGVAAALLQPRTGEVEAAALWKLPELWTHRAAPTAPRKTTEQVFHSYHRAFFFS